VSSQSTLRAGLRSLDVEVHRGSGSKAETRPDWVVVEEPLQIRVLGEPIAVTMRTPGDDNELAAGFLLAEGLIATRRDLGGIAVCGHPTDPGYGNVIEVMPAPGTVFDLDQAERSRRSNLTTAACGLCGRQSIDDLLARCPVLSDEARFDATVISRLSHVLRNEQPNFARTGGLHAAGLATPDGRFRLVREDVGRHNAVDKVLGRLLLDDQIPATGTLLVVSGRTSFEIVQKALVARVSAVVSVSAPSSLAVETARRSNLTLVGFARDGVFNVYAGAGRIRSSEGPELPDR
jgi:FdhD protein